MSLIKHRGQKKNIITKEYNENNSRSQFLDISNHSTCDTKPRTKSRDVSLEYNQYQHEHYEYNRIHYYDRHCDYNKLKRNLSEDRVCDPAQRSSNKISKSPSPLHKGSLLTTSNTSSAFSKYNKPYPSGVNNNNILPYNIHNYSKYASQSQTNIIDNHNSNTSFNPHSYANNNNNSNNNNGRFYKALDDISHENNDVYPHKRFDNGKHNQTQIQVYNVNTNGSNQSNITTSTRYDYITPYNHKTNREHYQSQSQLQSQSQTQYNYKNFIKSKSPISNLSYRRINQISNGNTSNDYSPRLPYETNKSRRENNDREYDYKASVRLPRNNDYMTRKDLHSEEDHHIKTRFNITKQKEPQSQREQIETIEEMHFTFVTMIQNTKKVIAAQETWNCDISNHDYGNKDCDV